MKVLQKKKTTQNKKNSIYQGTHMLAGAVGKTHIKQKGNKTKQSMILRLEQNSFSPTGGQHCVALRDTN